MSIKREMTEVRWYKGKYRVEVLEKSKGNWLVKALEFIPSNTTKLVPKTAFCIDVKFTTVPRLLWRHPRK